MIIIRKKVDSFSPPIILISKIFDRLFDQLLGPTLPPAHHPKKPFKQEYLEFLKKIEIEYDEKMYLIGMRINITPPGFIVRVYDICYNHDSLQLREYLL